MPKEKLTLYMDEKTSRMAHQVAKSTGKSVSELVREYTLRMYQTIGNATISPDIAKWVGALKSKQSYRQLRQQLVRERISRYEGSR